MASFPSKISKFPLLDFALILFLFISSVSSHKFEVGGDKGWIKPSASANYTAEPPYNAWAAKHRFRIGDTLYFKYQLDSVLVVDYEHYQNCITSNPISKYGDGNTVFEFNRSGFFYFISGEPGHCRAGQKLIVRVMHHSKYHPPESAPLPSPSSGRDHRGRDSHDSANSTTKLAVASYLMTAVGGVLVMLCLFM